MTATLMDLNRSLLTQAVKARLVARVGGVTADTVYEGEADDVPVDDGYADKYLCLYPSAGVPSPEDDLAAQSIDLDWGIQITCAAGFQVWVEELITDVHAAMFRWSPTVGVLVCGMFAPPLGFNPGSIMWDRDYAPHRPFVPLQYTTRVTAN